MIAFPSVLLPQPLSPTRLIISPARISKLTSSTALTVPYCDGNWTVRSLAESSESPLLLDVSISLLADTPSHKSSQERRDAIEQRRRKPSLCLHRRGRPTPSLVGPRSP